MSFYRNNTQAYRLIAKLTVIAIAMLVFLLPQTVYAETVWNGNNYYMGIYYGDSVERVGELKEIIETDGYICISYGYGYDEYADLMTNEIGEFYWFTHLLKSTDDYLVYVPQREMEWFAEGKCGTWTLNMATVCLDYYCFNHSDDMGVKYSDQIGNDNIPDNFGRGMIKIQCTVPEELAGTAYKYADATIFVDLYGEEQNAYYSVEISGINDYYYSETFIADRYKVVGARINVDGYIVQFAEDSYRLGQGQELNFLFDIVDRTSVEEQAISEISPNRPVSATLITDIQDTAKKNPIGMMISAFIGFGLVIFGCTQILNHLKRQREDTEYEGVWQKWWVAIIILGVLIPLIYSIVSNMPK